MHVLKTARVFERVRASEPRDARRVSRGTRSGVQNREPPWSSSSAGDGIRSRLDRPLNWLLHFSIITIICGYYKRRLFIIRAPPAALANFSAALRRLGSPQQSSQNAASQWMFLAFDQFATAPHGGREGGACLFYLIFCLWRLNAD